MYKQQAKKVTSKKQGEKPDNKGENKMWGKIFEKVITAVVMKSATEGLKQIVKSYAKVKDWWNGKSIAVIGSTASGKNSFFNKLKLEEIPNQHIQTRGSEKVKTFKFEYGMPDRSKIHFRCTKSFNVGGEIDERERYWLQSCEDADVIFYLIDFGKLMSHSDDTINRISSDFEWLSTHLPYFKADSYIHVLVNKIDLLLGDEKSSKDKETILADSKPQLEKIEEIAKKIFGSHFGRISGINPISMKDSYLFSQFFTITLESVFNESIKKG